ncbi:MAG: hypothetical protein ABWZ54_12080 [Luteibacter sp.]
MAQTSTKNILHVRPGHFVSAVATGIAVTGPTDDGFIHLHFFREAQRITNDEVPSRAASPNEVELAWGQAEPNIHLVREEVAVISVPVGRLPFVSTALNKAVRFVARVMGTQASRPPAPRPMADPISESAAGPIPTRARTPV